MRPRLRLFTGEDDGYPSLEPQVTVRLRDITRLLSDAVDRDRTWLSDFENDEIRVSTDLYEVISSYSHLRPSA
jgi:hypothetical protein